MKLPEKLLKWEEILKPGTPFWYISLYKKQKKEKCPVCKGKGEVKIEGRVYDCPECHGWKTKLVQEPEAWHVESVPGRAYCVVTRVDVEPSKKDGYYKVMYWDNCNGFPAEKVFSSHNLATRKVNSLNKKLEELRKEIEV